MLDPSSRDVSDIKHTVVAAASSSSAERAQKFLQECNCPSDAAAYGSYTELVNDQNVDIVYIATPHSHHYQNAMLCLEAGKHVLCEKSFTVNAAQTKKLVETAKAKKLFLMEAVWTRYFPLSIQVRKLITDGVIGDVHRVIADLSFGDNVEEKWGTEHRMVNMNLAGGALLDRRPSHQLSGTRDINITCSRHLRYNLGLPNPLPYPTRVRPQTSKSRQLYDQIPLHRRRRDDIHDPDLPHLHTQRFRARHRPDKSPRGHRRRRPRQLQPGHPHPRHERRDPS